MFMVSLGSGWRRRATVLGSESGKEDRGHKGLKGYQKPQKNLGMKQQNSNGGGFINKARTSCNEEIKF